MEHKANKEAERQQAAEEVVRQRASIDQIGADPPEIVQTCIIATFGRKTREAALAAGATMDQALEGEEKAAAEAEATLSAASVMRE